MNELNKPEYTQYFLAYGPNGTRHDGTVDPNQVLSSGQPSLITDSDPNNFIKSSSDAGVADYNPLPEYDELNEIELLAGEIYSYSSSLVIVRQTHNRTIYPPQDTPALFTTYRENPENAEWISNESVIVGDVRIYNTIEYRALQTHTTQDGWEPPNVPALWKSIVVGIQPWVQPTGAHDAYALNAEVTHNGFTWRSLYDANVWEPGVFGWEVV